MPDRPRSSSSCRSPTCATHERIAAITAPTLIVHAKDDALQLFHNAEFAASTITGARLVSFDKGGHPVVVIEQDTIRDAVRRHIVEHAGMERRH